MAHFLKKNQIVQTVKHERNTAMHVLHNVIGLVINTTADPLGRYRLHLLLPVKCSMAEHLLKSKESHVHSPVGVNFLHPHLQIHIRKFRQIKVR